MDFTKYERARIIGARSLQLSLGAPLLIKRSKDEFDVVDLATRELDSGVLPITIKRPVPKKFEA